MSAINISDLLSAPMKELRPSPLGEISAIAAKAKAIDLSGGVPDPILLPVAEFAGGALVLGRDGMRILQYGTTAGYMPLREFMAGWLKERVGRDLTANDVVITSGSQQAFSLTAAALLDAGDAVLTEEATYPGAISIMRSRAAHIVPVKSGLDGMDVDAAEEAMDRAAADGHKVKIIYTIPNFQNPTGALMPEESRRRLVEAASRRGVIIFEDDPYGELRYKGEPVRSLASIDAEMGTGCTVNAGSFSKLLAPGPRVAWVTGPADLIKAMIAIKNGYDISTSIIAQALVAKYCEDGYLDAVIEKFKAAYRKKRDTMAASLLKHMPKNAEFKVPDGGYFFWVKVPGVDTNKLFLNAVERGAAFAPGGIFCPAGGGTEHMRLCFTRASLGEIEASCASIGEAIASR